MNNDGIIISKGKPKYFEQNIFQCHCVRQKFHTNWSGIERGPPRWLNRHFQLLLFCNRDLLFGLY